ncbi:MAG: hypothetical protein JST13_10945, partial [Bacteroidetes bacterium]|nr:hypothetical protein [Bacteroidota bacterium]
MEIELLKRFSKVFNQAYTRFLDLQKAEAQARESQIQLAMERVRARSLAMHHTSELQDVVNILAQQLHNMGMDINGGVFITINDEVGENFPLWASSGAADYIQKAVVPFFDKPIYTHLRDAIKKRNNFFEETYSKKEKDEMFKHLFRYAPWNSQPEKRKKELLSREGGLTRLAAIFRHTCIAFTNHNGKMFLEEEKEILKRFGNVFEQTYIRFLDLQKAEAQAREAQIEAALERVRAKAMAMHKSDDIAITASAAFEELKKLGINSIRCGVGLFFKDSKDAQVYAATQTGEDKIKTLIKNRRMDEHPALVKQFESWEKQEDHEQVLTGEELKSYYNKSFFQASGVKASSNYHNQSEYGYYFAFRDGLFYSWSVQPYTNNEKDILNRFRSIIALTFRRFLDLQKAEAQAREAQIEAALERVRSKTMAMHNSQDVAETVGSLFDELIKLGFEKTSRCGIGIMHENEKMETWTARSGTNGNIDLIVGRLDMSQHSLLQGAYNGWKNKKDLFSYELRGNDLVNYYTILNNNPDYPIKYDISGLPSKIFHNDFYFPEGVLYAFSFEQLSDEAVKIFKRFAAVFGQTYRRYLDLLKAEAQTRESQIQLALERVRARTMAMHNSNELGEVAVLLFEQVRNLGIENYASGFNIWDKEQKNVVSWMSNPTNTINPPFEMPIHSFAQHEKIYKAWKKHEVFLEDDITGKSLVKHYQFLRSFPLLDAAFKKSEAAGIKTPNRQVHNIAFFSKGYLLFITLEPCPQLRDIFIRFAQVFEQTYTRFLDLQKAEAQAREAQIEAALERVRSRSMAMHKSDELKEVIRLVLEQFVQLKINAQHAGFYIDYKNQDDMHIWLADPNLEPFFAIIPYFDAPTWNSFLDAKAKGIPLHTDLLN